jgi:hypothetical protein
MDKALPGWKKYTEDRKKGVAKEKRRNLRDYQTFEHYYTCSASAVSSSPRRASRSGSRKPPLVGRHLPTERRKGSSLSPSL